MSLLDDPALILGVAKPRLVEAAPNLRVRFKPTSEQARAMGVPTERIGTVRAVYGEGPERRANIDFGPGLYLTSARIIEMEVVGCL